VRDRASKGLFCTLFHEARQDEDKFYNFVRMSSESLNILKQKLRKLDTHEKQYSTGRKTGDNSQVSTEYVHP
jgi:hypothetical protein